MAAIGRVCLWGMFSTGLSAEEKRTAIWLVALRGWMIPEKESRAKGNERERKRGRERGGEMEKHK